VGAADPRTFLVFLLAAGRTLGLLLAPGWPGGDLVPWPVRGGVAAALGVVLTPVLTAQTLTLPATPGGLVAALAANAAVGLALGFGVGLLWSAVEMAGAISELAVGLNPESLFGTTQAQGTTPLTQLYSLMLALLFFGGGGLEIWLGALGRSFDALPIAGRLFGTPDAAGLTALVGRLLGVALSLAAPVLLSLLIVNLSLAVAGRITAQASLYFAALPAELASVLVALALTAGIVVTLEGRLLGGLDGMLGVSMRAIGR
jgi:flagellar biosynthetic protein FliR